MKQSTSNSYSDIQKQLLEVIGRINRNSEDIDKGLSGKSEIILLVGDTGAGKSTVFNLLCGAQFELKKEGIKDVLSIKKGTRNFSEMKHGTKSITTEPKYHFIDEINHLIIDFPGFRDTRGQVEELVIQLLFNRIVTKNKVKLVYLVQQPLLSLPNRGTFVQDFLNIFKNQPFKFSDSILLLNSFALEDVEENVLIQNAKDELKSITKDPEQQNQTICVMRNVNASRLAQLPNIRKKILQQIASSRQISFRPFEIKDVEIISKYLLRVSKAITDSIYDGLKGEIQDQIMASNNETLVKLQIILRSMKQMQSKKTSEKYQKLFTIYEELTQSLGCKQKIDIQQNVSFFKIYNYFEEFSDFIEGYNVCADNLEKIIDMTSLFDKQIEAKLAQSNLQKEQVKQLKQQQAEFQQQYQQMQKKMFESMEAIRKEEKKTREEQLQQIKQQNEQQLKMLQAQIAQQQQQNKDGGLFDKILQIAQVALPIALKFI